MKEQSLEALAQRVERVERENRRLKFLAAAATLVVGVVLLMGATGSKIPEEIRAKRFVAVDERGRTRAELGITDTRVAVLRLFSGEQMAVNLTEEPGLMLFGRLGIVNLEPNTLTFGGKGTRRHVRLFSYEDFQSLTLHDQNGVGRIELRIGSDGIPVLTLRDKDGKNRAVLGATSLETTKTGEITQRPESSLVLFDKNGKVLWDAP